MFAILHSLGMFVVDLFKPRRRLVAENLFLRHQLSIALRRAPPRLRLRGRDRALLVWMTRRWPSLLGAAQVVQPDLALPDQAQQSREGIQDRKASAELRSSPHREYDRGRAGAAATRCFPTDIA